MLVALLTDFGLDDTFVGVMKAIILTIAPATPIVDLTHLISPQNVAAGAWALWTAYPYLPAEAIIVGIVDPGVGTARRPVAIQHASGRIFVGPDNGLATRVMALDPPTQAVILDNPAFWLEPTRHPSGTLSRTFHGRDLFAPVAAHLAGGLALEQVGTLLDIDQLHQLPLSTPHRDGDHLIVQIIAVDHFGNLITDIGPEVATEFFAAPHIHAHLGSRHIDLRAATYGEGPPDRPFWYRDSSGHVAIAIRDGHAAQQLSVGVGTRFNLRLGPPQR